MPGQPGITHTFVNPNMATFVNDALFTNDPKAKISPSWTNLLDNTYPKVKNLATALETIPNGSD